MLANILLNLIIENNENVVVVKISDFGLSKHHRNPEGRFEISKSQGNKWIQGP